MESAIGLCISVIALAIFTGKGWGVSTTFGFWFGKLAILFGADPVQLGDFTTKGAEFFEKGILENSGSVMNIGIIIGAIAALVMMNRFKPTLKITGKEVVLFLLAGLVMGIGTRLANGCNAGALYTPMYLFSLSGWAFLPTMIFGGIIGNKILRKVL